MLPQGSGQKSRVTSWSLEHAPYILLSADVATRSLRLVTVAHGDWRLTIMLARILSIIGLVSAGLLLFLLTTTTPADVGAFGILAAFFLIYSVTLSLFTFSIWIVSQLVDKLGRRTHLLRKPYVFTLRKAYYYASVLALGPVIIMSLQTVGGVGVYELGLVGLFMFLGCLYVAKRFD